MKVSQRLWTALDDDPGKILKMKNACQIMRSWPMKPSQKLWETSEAPEAEKLTLAMRAGNLQLTCGGQPEIMEPFRDQLSDGVLAAVNQAKELYAGVYGLREAGLLDALPQDGDGTLFHAGANISDSLADDVIVLLCQAAIAADVPAQQLNSSLPHRDSLILQWSGTAVREGHVVCLVGQGMGKGCASPLQAMQQDEMEAQAEQARLALVSAGMTAAQVQGR